MGFDQNRGDTLNVQVAAFNETKETVEELPFWKQPDTIELVKDLLKYMLIAAAMLFVVFRVIKPALHPLFVVPEFKAEDIVQDDSQEETRESIMQKASYDTNLQTARQIAKQEPKIVASVVKEWMGHG